MYFCRTKESFEKKDMIAERHLEGLIWSADSANTCLAKRPCPHTLAQTFNKRYLSWMENHIQPNAARQKKTNPEMIFANETRMPRNDWKSQRKRRTCVRATVEGCQSSLSNLR